MDAELREMCRAQLYYRPAAGIAPGTPDTVLGAPIPVHGKIDQFARIVTDSQNRSVGSNTLVILLPDDDTGVPLTVDTHGELTLPEGYAPQVPPIISVSRKDDPETGAVDHWEVYL